MLDDIDPIAAIRAQADRALDAIVSGETLRRLLDNEIRYDERYWEHCREQGWTSIGIAEAFGGVGLGLAAICALAEAGGNRTVGAPFLESGFAAAQAIGHHGDAATRAEWLPRLATGEAIGLLSIADGNAALPVGTALRFADGQLRGARTAVPAAACARVAILSATCGTEPGLVLVDLDAAGVSRRPIDSFDPGRCPADLMFDDAPARRLATADLASLLHRQAVVAAHQQLGGAQRMLSEAREHALRRRAFGQPIGGFQSVKHRIAENYILVELARASAAEALAASDTPGFARAAISARLLATDAYESCARDAIQIHGGIGASWESDLHLHQRRARSLALELGSILSWQDMLVDALVEQAG